MTTVEFHIKEIGNGYIVQILMPEEEPLELFAKDLKEITMYLDQYISGEHNKEEK